jgi:hypothetical protein
MHGQLLDSRQPPAKRSRDSRVEVARAYASHEDVTDIACDVAVDNVASRRVAENGGFSDPTPYTDPDGHAMVRYTLGVVRTTC